MSAVLRRVMTPAVVGTGLAVVLGGAAAAAYRAGVSTSGTGGATPAAATPLTLTATGTVSTSLYPGGPGADVTVVVTNPHGVPVTVTGVGAAGAVTATPVEGRVCATHGVTVVAPVSGLPAVVPARSSVTLTLRGVATMGLAAESGCQGASFTIPFTVTGRL